MLCQQRHGTVDRWPDVVIEHPDGWRVAVEIELAAKTTERLTGILLGYLVDGTYARVQVRCGDVALERRVRRIVERLGGAEVIVVAGV